MARDYTVATTNLDQVVLNLFTLAWQASRICRINGDYAIRLTVEPMNRSGFRRPDPTQPGKFEVQAREDDLIPFQPVEGSFIFSESIDAAMDSLVEVARDSVSQLETCEQRVSRLHPP